MNESVRFKVTVAAIIFFSVALIVCVSVIAATLMNIKDPPIQPGLISPITIAVSHRSEAVTVWGGKATAAAMLVRGCAGTAFCVDPLLVILVVYRAREDALPSLLYYEPNLVGTDSHLTLSLSLPDQNEVDPEWIRVAISEGTWSEPSVDAHLVVEVATK